MLCSSPSAPVPPKCRHGSRAYSWHQGFREHGDDIRRAWVASSDAWICADNYEQVGRKQVRSLLGGLCPRHGSHPGETSRRLASRPACSVVGRSLRWKSAVDREATAILQRGRRRDWSRRRAGRPHQRWEEPLCQIVGQYWWVVAPGWKPGRIAKVLTRGIVDGEDETLPELFCSVGPFHEVVHHFPALPKVTSMRRGALLGESPLPGGRPHFWE